MGFPGGDGGFYGIDLRACFAAAYAEAGDFDKAVEWEEKVRKLWTDADVIKKSDKRLSFFKEKKPYREEAGK